MVCSAALWADKVLVNEELVSKGMDGTGGVLPVWLMGKESGRLGALQCMARDGRSTIRYVCRRKIVSSFTIFFSCIKLFFSVHIFFSFSL